MRSERRSWKRRRATNFSIARRTFRLPSWRSGSARKASAARFLIFTWTSSTRGNCCACDWRERKGSRRSSSRRGSIEKSVEEMKQRSNEVRTQEQGKRGTMYRAPARNDSRVELNQFEAGEEVADFEGGGFRSVGAMSAIVADAGAEVVADGA